MARQMHELSAGLLNGFKQKTKPRYPAMAPVTGVLDAAGVSLAMRAHWAAEGEMRGTPAFTAPKLLDEPLTGFGGELV
jgi:hypothetical protein